MRTSAALILALLPVCFRTGHAQTCEVALAALTGTLDILGKAQSSYCNKPSLLCKTLGAFYNLPSPPSPSNVDLIPLFNNSYWKFDASWANYLVQGA